VYSKVSLPGRLAADLIPTPGNHTATSSNGVPVLEQPAASYYLAHFPVRSAEQIIVKNLLATHNLTARIDALPGEGFHVHPILCRIRERAFALTLQDLQDIAFNYGGTEQRSASREDLIDGDDHSALRTELQYSHLSRINVVARLDSELERLSKDIRSRNARGPFNATYVQARRDA
jgi:hypothetical protein